MTDQDVYRYALTVAAATIAECAGSILDRDRSLSDADRAVVQMRLGVIANLLWGESTAPAPPDDDDAP